MLESLQKLFELETLTGWKLSSDRVRLASKIESKVIKTTKTVAGMLPSSLLSSGYHFLSVNDPTILEIFTRDLSVRLPSERNRRTRHCFRPLGEKLDVEESKEHRRTVPFFMAERRHEENKKGLTVILANLLAITGSQLVYEKYNLKEHNVRS